MVNELNSTPVFILAGGVGERLAPLTTLKPKPAITFGGTHQILDFTLSNCVNSGLRNIFVLTQYLRDHLHDYVRASRMKLAQRFRWNSKTCLVSLPPGSGKKYRGTFDAVFQNVPLLLSSTAEHVLITAGDHVYSMDYGPLLERHISSGAEMTMAAVRCPASEATAFGVLDVEHEAVTRFTEKPSRNFLPNAGDVLVSMGVYVFKRECLIDLAESVTLTETDFGRHIVPRLIRSRKVAAYDFGSSPRSYWRDVGTLDSYFRANMDLLGAKPKFNPDVDAQWPIFSVNDSSSVNVGGSRISRRAMVGPSVIRRSVVSHGACIDSGAIVENSIILPGARVGRDVLLRNAIVTEGVRVADGAEIGVNSSNDREHFSVTPEGIVVVNAIAQRVPDPFCISSLRLPAAAA
jgi:glucose-1-phosphate adenylyltransferase